MKIHWTRWTIAVLAGCAASSSYVYSPQDAGYSLDGYPVAMTRVPPEAPQGKVEVTSFGIVELKPAGDAPFFTLHVRLALTNEGDATAWTLTTSDQLVEIAGEGRSQPIYVNTNVQTLPTVSIAQRERRIVDLYYPLPATIDDNDDLPAFDFLWQVTTPTRTFASRSRFERLEQEPPETYTRVVFVSGWGPYWWYDPMFPRFLYVHHRPLVIHRSPHVIVTRPPMRHYRTVRDHRHRRE